MPIHFFAAEGHTGTSEKLRKYFLSYGVFPTHVGTPWPHRRCPQTSCTCMLLQADITMSMCSFPKDTNSVESDVAMPLGIYYLGDHLGVAN